ncbi:MAG: hypothetical protein RIS47_1561 [Bacteroidota bacterium]|jgi:hypothetical protein
MEAGWSKLETFDRVFVAEMHKDILLDNAIACVMLNGQDSSYLFGEISLYVRDEDMDKALEILKANKDLE